MAEKLWGYSPAGLFGYSHMLGGYAGGQAEYARVPFADVGPIKVPDDLPDEQVLFLSDIFPTGYMGAEMCDIKPGDTSRCGVRGRSGQFAIAALSCSAPSGSSRSTGSPIGCGWRGRRAGAETINYEEVDVYEALMEMTGGRGPDACIDAVGHGGPRSGAALRLRPCEAGDEDWRRTGRFALREAIMACRNGGTVSVIGVYGGFIDKFPMGSVMNRSLTIRDWAVPRPAVPEAAAGPYPER